MPPPVTPYRHRIRVGLQVLYWVGAALGWLFLPELAWQPDGLSYWVAGGFWAQGNYGMAVHNLYSNFYALLQAPGHWLGMGPILWLKLTNLLGGGISLRLFISLVQRHDLTPRSQVLFGLAALPLLLGAGLLFTTPDTWACAYVLLLWANCLRYTRDAVSTLVIFRSGVLLAGSYFVKPYLFVFTAVVLAGLGLWRYMQLRAKPYQSAKHILLLALPSFVLLGIFSSLLEAKYGPYGLFSQQTYATLAHTGKEGGAAEASLAYGALPRPYEAAYSPADDPLYGATRQELLKRADRHEQTRPNYALRIKQNAYMVQYSLRELSWVWLLMLGLVPFALYALRYTKEAWMLAGFTLIYIGGYLLLHIEARFLLPVPLLALLMLAHWQGERGLPARWLLAIALGVVIVAGQRSTSQLWVESSRMAAYRQLGQHLQAASFSGAEVISSDHWAPSLQVCYYMGKPYLGLQEPQEARHKLNTKSIQLLAWTDWPLGQTFIAAPLTAAILTPTSKKAGTDGQPFQK